MERTEKYWDERQDDQWKKKRGKEGKRIIIFWKWQPIGMKRTYIQASCEMKKIKNEKDKKGRVLPCTCLFYQI